MSLLTIEGLEAALAARIVAVTSTPFVQGISTEVWAETDLALTATQDSVLQQHLAFSVSVEDAPVADDGNYAENRRLSILAQVQLMYVYRLRTDDQIRDQRLAATAARYLAAAMMLPDPRWGALNPVTIYRPSAVVNGYLPILQRYTTGIFDCPLPGA